MSDFLAPPGITRAGLDAAVTALQQDPASSFRTEQNATYARFVDENGNPLAGRHVVIKVSSTTGEIIDIVSEA